MAPKLKAELMRATRANQAAWRRQKAENDRQRYLQRAAGRRILSDKDEEDLGTPAQGEGAAGRSGAVSEDDSDSGSGVHAPPS